MRIGSLQRPEPLPASDQFVSGDLFMRFRLSLRLSAVLLLASAAMPVVLQAQGGHSNSVANNQSDHVTMATDKQGKPLPSPRHLLEFTHDHNGAQAHISLSYGAPSVRGRRVFGGEIVPYGQWWRAGANEATAFTTDHALRIGDLAVPAGSYTLDVLPAAAGWQLIVNKQTGQWGTEYDPSRDLGRVPMKLATLPTPQETLSYSFDHVTGNTATLHLRWATTDASVAV